MKHTRRLRALDALHLDRQVDLEEVMRLAVDEVRVALHADRGTIYLVDHARGQLVTRIADLPELAEIRLKIGEGIAGTVASTGELVNVRESTQDPRFSPKIDAQTGYRTHSQLAAPVRDADGGVIGVLQVLNKAEGEFDRADELLLAELAGELAGLLAATSLASQLQPGQRQPLAFRFNNIVGESRVMQAVFDRTARAARTDATVLVRGESGSGKEAIARAVHFNSPRRDAPFVKVDCAALPENLIENELFGHEKGAFTGADRAADGKVQAAEGGTLFLDEVGELPLPVQGKLLRLLQERTFLKVGGNLPAHADVRFVAATNRDLEDLVREGRFRQDLYYRLRVVQLDLPSLRERGAPDIDRLIDHFVFAFTRRHGRPELTLSPAARATLLRHDWPGNVRELEHCIESAVVLAPGNTITPDQLSLGPSSGEHTRLPATVDDPDTFRTGVRPLREVELDYLRHVLARCDGNRSQAARVLGIGRNTLLRKLKDADGQP
jgi:Nif-specific regulatory protein